MSKLTIACPTFDDKCHMAFAMSLYGTNWPGEKPPILKSTGKWVAKALKEMVLASQRHGAKFMIWISCDVAWHPDAIKKLVDLNLPIVGGWASGRCAPFKCHVSDRYDEEKAKFRIVQNPEERKGVERVASMGGEMICFRMDVFDDIPRPWFFGKDMISDDDMMTEDYYFFKQCKERGINVFVDWDLPLYHGTSGLMTYKGDLVAR